MSNTVISVENLSKSYRLGVIGTGTFYDDLKDWWAKKRGRSNSYVEIRNANHGNRQETIFALKDINFKVAQGETLGIIGRNGAGKSTLLKILSRITAPTSGVVKIKGRVASLLEVGTGFHPELTGRQNIYLNGAILGMTRPEINRKVDEIIDFSGVEKFIDTPVKRYSSGMYVRLAFSVAAHLETEILIVDEILSVGDAEFREKCLGKMGEAAGGGRTVLFVSHNMGAISKLCDTGFWLDHGQIVQSGKVNDVIPAYLSSNMKKGACVGFEDDPLKDGQIVEVEINDSHSRQSNQILVTEPFKVNITYVLKKPTARFRTGILIQLPDGVEVIASSSTDQDGEYWNAAPGKYTATVEIPGHLFMPGQYLVSCFLGQPGIRTLDNQSNVLSFHIEGSPRPFAESWPGILALQFPWKTEESQE